MEILDYFSLIDVRLLSRPLLDHYLVVWVRADPNASRRMTLAAGRWLQGVGDEMVVLTIQLATRLLANKLKGLWRDIIGGQEVNPRGHG